MNYTIIIQQSAQKELKKLPYTELKKIQKLILSLAKNPFPKGSLKLEGTNEKLYRVRKGDYRIIYTVDHHIVTITILKIAHRRDVYRF
ncbi:MAG: type II toxin-antitoxin system RelE/ParE family toxin [Bacteroidetes bacterium]|nr:type II toxin-antitoxin system RelE/ParE family toxin [Bacteroidota bacterium]